MVYNDITKTDNIFKRKDDLICFILLKEDMNTIGNVINTSGLIMEINKSRLSETIFGKSLKR